MALRKLLGAGLCLIVLLEPLLPGGALALEGQVDVEVTPPSYLSRLQMTTPVIPNDELRALWVVRHALTSVDAVDRVVDFAEQARFHILFVQVRGRGDAYYRSSLVPPAPDLAAPVEDFDPLEYLIIRARRAGISVHAWLNVFYVWSNPAASPPPDHVVSRHPEWLLSDETGTRMDQRSVKWWQQDGIEGYYLSPAIPAVRRHLADVVRELVGGYALDGIHLDYIRFPKPGFSFDDDGRTEFALAFGADPASLRRERAELQGLVGRRGTALLDSVYVERRAQAVDSVVVAIRAACPGLALSAAVVADLDQSRRDKGQDWVRWVHRRDVDFVVPMAYNYSPQGLADYVPILSRTIGADRYLVGLALHDGRHAFLAESVTALREQQAAGFAIFSYNVLSEMKFPAAFVEETIFPPRDVDPQEDEGTE